MVERLLGNKSLSILEELMEAHLASLHDRMWEVIEKGHIKFGDWSIRSSGTQDEQSSAAATATKETNNRPNVIVDVEQSKLMNLDKVARVVLLQVVGDAHLNKIKHCKTSKQIWNALADMCE
ncbi:hypothetical protein ACS0TY_006423 [Phlomoides rotata]